VDPAPVFVEADFVPEALVAEDSEKKAEVRGVLVVTLFSL
jgi:hypothetical protein